MRPWATARRGVEPRTRTVPLVGWVRPRTMSRVVDLPAPLGPRKATTSPGPTLRSRPFTACTAPKVFLRSDRAMAGVEKACEVVLRGVPGEAVGTVLVEGAGVLMGTRFRRPGRQRY